MKDARGQGVYMKKILKILIVFSICLLTSACGGNLFTDRPGSIAMQSYTNEELGIRGARPFYCNPQGSDTFECSALNSNRSLVIMNQLAFPGTREELIALLSEQTGLTEIPPQVGTYQSSALTWELYEFDMTNKVLGPVVFHAHLALAEDQARIYLIALSALPGDYQANRGLYQSVFEHALYAFEPLEQD